MKSILFKALKEKESVELIYISDNKVITQRIIKVLAIKDSNVGAYCYTRKQYRTFKLEQILSLFPMRKKVIA